MAEPKKIKAIDKNKADFKAPDGGWGWVIIIAAGLSNLFVLPMFQQFGLIFRDKFARLGFSSSQTTTIINVNSALTSCVGLANGPMFRKFSFRQVSLAGSIMIVVSLVLTTFCNSFVTYIISFSVVYGVGYGISSSANALALNTYWKERRRIATGLSWTMTGLGPIVWPHVITVLFALYGETGSTLVLSGFALHSIALALLLHPVQWHVKTTPKNEGTKTTQTNESFKQNKENGYFGSITRLRNISAFSSQYLYNEDDPTNPGYEIIDPGVPMMVRANDSYFSQSRQPKNKVPLRDESGKTSSMNSKKPSMTNLTENRSRKPSVLYLCESRKGSSSNLCNMAQERDGYKPKRKNSVTMKTFIPESEVEDCPSFKAPQDLKSEEKAVIYKTDPEKSKLVADKARKSISEDGGKILTALNVDEQYSDNYNKNNHSNLSMKNLEYYDDRKYLKDNHSNKSYSTRNRRKSNNFNFENEILKQASLKLEQYLKDKEDDDADKLKLLLNGNLDDNVFNEKTEEKEIEIDEDEEMEKLTLWQKMVMFFDLDLLKDFTFVNLMLGLTLACFSELNFSLLTPFILGDFGLSKPQVATFLSILGGCDISVRFCVPFIAGKIGWENNTFFLVGVLIMSFGRVILAHFFHSYYIVLAVAVIIGLGKGLRTVFMALVIPTYVPLHKLPGATGLQLVTAGVVYFLLGPLLGYTKDNASTVIMLYSLNIFAWLTALSWGFEKYVITKIKDKTDEERFKI